jgi:hypothetical protein
MSTPFYDLASLVVVPSGYKASKVYAQKPLTTDGQLTFSRASTATRVNASGLIETVSSNVPRLDYLNSSCPRLLLEPQRTNNITYSEQLDNAAWTLATAGSASAAVVTANYGISPDGTQNADRVQFSRTGTTYSDYSLLDRTTISTAAGVVSFYGKSLSGTQSILLYYGSVGQVFTLTTEWQRFSLYAPTTTTDLSIGTRGGSGSYFNGGSLTIDCLLWGFQKEAGAYATSYIPTTTAAVTRLADACSKTGISSLIGQTEGVLFVDFVPNNTPASGVQQWLFFLGSGSAYIAIYISSGQKLIGNVANTTDQALITTSFNLVAGTRYKAALAYKANDFAFYVNGVQVGLDTSGTVPAVSTLQNNYNTTAANSSNAGLSQTLLFKTRLTNAQLAELTTL